MVKEEVIVFGVAALIVLYVCALVIYVCALVIRQFEHDAQPAKPLGDAPGAAA